MQHQSTQTGAFPTYPQTEEYSREWAAQPQRHHLQQPFGSTVQGDRSFAPAAATAGSGSASSVAQPTVSYESSLSQQQTQQQPYGALYHPQAPVEAFVPEPVIAPEPQVFVKDESIVLILKPKEFFRKKAEFMKAGASQIQLFSDFEHALTKFRLQDGSKSFTTSEVLESSPVLSMEAVAKLRLVVEEFESSEMDDSSLGAFSEKCHSIIAKEGKLHISSILPLTQDYLTRIAMRSGWKEMLQSLALSGVPTFIFSSGYGDIVQQALLLGGIGEHGMLPQNLRIVSNFFKTAPDGTVRAFSSPTIHERNKNATTASEFMGFPLPERKFGLV